MHPLVSIVVPVYNVDKYIERCFRSVASQTYQSIECIFVDDCSPDSSVAILNGLVSEYLGVVNFEIVSHDRNRGLSAARNTGTEYATGDYIYYLDSDDEITPNCIEILVSYVLRYPNVQLIQGKTLTIPAPRNDWRDISKLHYPEYVSDPLWIKRSILVPPRIPVNAWNKLLSRHFVLENSLYFYEGVIHEDECWMFYVAKRLSSIAFVQEYTYYHYVVPGSIMQSGSFCKSLSSMIVILRKMISDIDSQLSGEQRLFIYSHLRSNLYKASVSDCDEDYFKLYIDLARVMCVTSIQEGRYIDFFYLKLLMVPKPLHGFILYRKLYGLMLRFFR